MGSGLRPSYSLLLLVAGPCLAEAQSTQAPVPAPRIWFVQAGASGDGRDRTSPFGSTVQVEQESTPGDIIFLLPADVLLEEGLALKPRQVLLGVRSESGGYPLLSNTAGDRNGGNGLILADGVRIEGVEIRNTRASGIYGVDVRDVDISDVLVSNANTGQLTVPGVFMRENPLTHGGITLLGLREGGAASLDLRRVRVLQSAGMGIGVVAANGSGVTLRLQDGEVRDGPAIGPADRGVSAYAFGDSSSVSIDLIRSAVSGRMGRNGRNVSLAASSGGTVRGLVYESIVGESGQDGIIAAAYQLPAAVDLMIVASTIENAAQSNVEGTMLALPHDEAAASASRMDVSIHRSTIRGAGSTPGSESGSFNVLMTGSPIPPDQPLPTGQYRLRVTDSEIEASHAFGLWVGAPWGGAPIDHGRFDVLVRGTRFLRNEAGDVMIGAQAAQVDARQNCWSSPDGREGARVVTTGANVDGSVDTSNPVPCRR